MNCKVFINNELKKQTKFKTTSHESKITFKKQPNFRVIYQCPIKIIPKLFI